MWVPTYSENRTELWCKSSICALRLCLCLLHSQACGLMLFIFDSSGERQSCRCVYIILQLPTHTTAGSCIYDNEINHTEWRVEKKNPFVPFWNLWSRQVHGTPRCIIHQGRLVLNFTGLFILFKCGVKFLWWRTGSEWRRGSLFIWLC